MSFLPGQIIVHPFHGPVTVVDVAPRVLGGAQEPYLELQTVEQGLRISVPTGRASSVGLRPLMTPDQIEELLGVMRQPSPAAVPQWARRIKAYREQLQLGSIASRAIVVRDILRDGRPRAGSEEQRLLAAARTPIVDEMRIVLHIAEEQALARIDEAVAVASEAVAA